MKHCFKDWSQSRFSPFPKQYLSGFRKVAVLKKIMDHNIQHESYLNMHVVQVICQKAAKSVFLIFNMYGDIYVGYSKTCVKRPHTNRRYKDLNDKL